MAAEFRRLGDSIRAAFDHALEQEDLEVAEHLYRALELVWTRPVPGRSLDRRNWEEDPVTSAFDRLENLRHARLHQPAKGGQAGSDDSPRGD